MGLRERLALKTQGPIFDGNHALHMWPDGTITDPNADRRGRVPEWIRRRQQKEAEARALFGTHRIADRVMDR